MAPRKRKSSKVALKEEEEKPEIALDFSEELETQIKKAQELAEAKRAEKKELKKDNVPKGGKIKQNIDKVNTKEGVIGYILRNAKSASIDLKDPTKIIDFAVLSSSALEAGEELSNTFELGDVKYVLVEGNTAKFLSFTAEENRVSVFMEKNVDHNRVYKDLLS
ncbi:roadblock/LC7 domain-containing protein [Candidatus Bathyarchaeota archaeon]|nr:roadblock/LC7 domain-containing protein [Candidatus Bathyarchaeota archaeon]